MHPDRAFDWTDHEAMLAFLAETSFATLFISTAQGPRLVHAPLLVAGPDRIRFHVSHRNAAAEADGARALISCLGAHAYVSPDWYATADQVPTWNYVTVECEGALQRLSEAELVAMLDGLSAVQEARLVPKPQWTRAKMTPRRFDAMVKAIVGYELRVDALRGTRKLGQNKSDAERAGASDALRAIGQEEMAMLMEKAVR